jgi:hypothetical protein
MSYRHWARSYDLKLNWGRRKVRLPRFVLSQIIAVTGLVAEFSDLFSLDIVGAPPQRNIFWSYCRFVIPKTFANILCPANVPLIDPPAST